MKRICAKPVILLLICCLDSSVNLHSQNYFYVHYDDFSVDYKPTKIPDTAIFKTLKAYPKSILKIYISDGNGKSYFELYDRNNLLKLTGYYSNSLDTLIKYKFSKSLGFTDGKSHYNVSLIKYLQPLPCGTWNYYEKQKPIRKIEYEFTHD